MNDLWKQLKDRWPKTTAKAEAQAANETAPPGWEPTVKALKGNPRVSNPWALAWWMKNRGMSASEADSELQDILSPPKDSDGKEGQAASSFGQLLRSGPKKPEDDEPDATAASESAHPSSPLHIHESFQRPFRESDVVDEDKMRIYTVLITEGLGNPRDRNYYGPEAIETAVLAFEGAQANLNHLTAEEEVSRPEGDVRQLCGQWSGLERIVVTNESGDEVSACAGWLNCTTSDAGRQAFELGKSAIRFRERYGIRNRDLVGISINGDGVSHEAEIEGVGLVNYVDQITEGSSCDLVMRAGRGGRFVNLMESLRSAERSGDRREVMNARTKVVREARKLIESHKKAIKSMRESLGNKKFQELLTALAEGKDLKEMDLGGLQDLAKDLQKLTDKGSIEMEDAVGMIGKSLDGIAKPSATSTEPPAEPDADDPTFEMGSGMEGDGENDDTGTEEGCDEGDEPGAQESREKGRRRKRESRSLQEKYRKVLEENSRLKKQAWLQEMRELAAEKLDDAIKEHDLPKGFLTVRKLVREAVYGRSIEKNEEAMDIAIEEQVQFVESMSSRFRETDDDGPRLEGSGHRRSGERATEADWAEASLKEHGIPLKKSETKKAS